MTTRIDMSPERNIAIGLITNTEFCKQILPILNPRSLKTPYARNIALWVADYFNAYHEAPTRNILDIFIDKKLSLRPDEADAMTEFFTTIESAYDQEVNLDWEKGRAEKYLKGCNAKALAEIIEAAVIEGEPEKAEAAIATYKSISLPGGNGISLMSDTLAIQHAFMEEDETLFKFPKALGKVLPPPQRGDLYAFVGAQKSGKSWCLQYVAEQAMAAQKRVVFFSLEMRQSQILRRAWQSLVSAPARDSELIIPFFKPCFPEDEPIEEAKKRWEIYLRSEMRRGVEVHDVGEIQARYRMMYRGGDIRFVTIPSQSATVEDLISRLDNLAFYEDYRPDVVVVDYADILKASKGAPSEERHRLNDIWLKLRGLAQARNVLVVTASQANRLGISGEITSENIAEDIRKLGHVSVMAALNRKKEDKLKSMVRVSSLAQRDGEEILQEAIVLQCLGMGRFHIDSLLANQIVMEE